MACALCLSRVAGNRCGISEPSQKARTADISGEWRPEADGQRSGTTRTEAEDLRAVDRTDVEPVQDDHTDQNWKVLDADTQSQDRPGQQRPMAHHQVQR